MQRSLAVYSHQGGLFLRQVKSHPACQGQNASRYMNQAHVRVAYKLSSLFVSGSGR